MDDEIVLCWPTPPDAEDLFALVEANRAYLARWLPWAQGHTLGDERKWVERQLRAQADGTGSPSLILYRGSLVGSAGVGRMDPPESKSCNLGYFLAEAVQGRGIVTRACSSLLAYSFDTLGMNRVQISGNPQNARSIAVPKRLGFVHEGTLRQAELLNGNFHDAAMYSMLASEWAELKSDGKIDSR